MTGHELEKAGLALYGKKWRVKLPEAFGVDRSSPRQTQRYQLARRQQPLDSLANFRVLRHELQHETWHMLLLEPCLCVGYAAAKASAGSTAVATDTFSPDAETEHIGA